MMDKWEYKIVKMGLFFSLKKKEEEINILGDQGWELVLADQYGVTLTFKRRKNKY